jgi:endonuclease-3
VAAETRLARILDRLEEHGGPCPAPALTDPYEMLLFTNCGYPASDAACRKGFEALKREVGLRPADILAAPEAKLRELLKLGGIVPELRAVRLKEIAARVQNKYGGDLRRALQGSVKAARGVLKEFPTIGDPGAEKILLFCDVAPVVAAPSSCLRVPQRLGFGRELKSYSASYKSVQEAIAQELPAQRDALLRCYQLLDRHGHTLCKLTRPACDRCPVTDECLYFQSTH